MFKKYFFIIHLILLSLTVKAQENKNDIENLINQVMDSLIPQEREYFLLRDESSVIKFKKSYYEYYVKYEFKPHIIQDFPVEILLASDSTEIKWYDYNIKRARRYDPENAKRYNWNGNFVIHTLVPYNTPEKIIDSILFKTDKIPIRVKRHWSEKKIDKEIEKQEVVLRKKYKDEEKYIYRISTPTFSEDKKFAYFSLNNRFVQCIYLYKKVNDKWMLIYEFACKVH
ncbi:hypothetical protein FUA48_10215 [Flavobacterium alkalisoli]|uniref:DUF4348 domain-containing protein n=1 Tax=Flavobacterium alkalisoli TaxID=2602769 RepID=A0A5B9FSE6_9FLAO|nr:hypothetical protein [Flavobacterium alkalisoli]QEE49940.1 hypothetical protein FUA48_10215 [Flavobacterium alkalisoli]